jgi:hypothetical protein
MVGHRQSPPLIGEAPVPASADAHIYANIAYCIKGAGMKNFRAHEWDMGGLELAQ